MAIRRKGGRRWWTLWMGEKEIRVGEGWRPLGGHLIGWQHMVHCSHDRKRTVVPLWPGLAPAVPVQLQLRLGSTVARRRGSRWVPRFPKLHDSLCPGPSKSSKLDGDLPALIAGSIIGVGYGVEAASLFLFGIPCAGNDISRVCLSLEIDKIEIHIISSWYMLQYY